MKLLRSFALALFWAALCFAPAIGITLTQPVPGARSKTIVIAPSSANFAAKLGADYICTGTHDEVVINNAIATLSNGGTVKLLQGIFYLSAPVIIDWDWVTLEGDGHPGWNRFVSAYPTHSIQGAPGGAQLYQVNGLANGITIGTSQQNMHGDTRHKGLAIRDLYLYSSSYGNSTSAIYDSSAADTSEIRNVKIHGFGRGINVSWDSPKIVLNDIQDIGYQGIALGGPLGYIAGNIIFDIAGPAIVVSGYGTIISGNMIGDITGGDAIQTNTTKGGFEITGNHIEGITTGNGINVLSTGGFNAITGNVIRLTGVYGPNTTNNTAYNGILVASANNTITGNVIDNNSSANSTGYALNISGNNNIATGNIITGAKWNSASTTFNVTASGTGNLLWNNVGQLALYSAAGTAVPACSASYNNIWLMVSDATAPTYNATYTSGGAVTVPVWCNGTNWLTH